MPITFGSKSYRDTASSPELGLNKVTMDPRFVDRIIDEKGMRSSGDQKTLEAIRLYGRLDNNEKIVYEAGLAGNKDPESLKLLTGLDSWCLNKAMRKINGKLPVPMFDTLTLDKTADLPDKELV